MKFKVFLSWFMIGQLFCFSFSSCGGGKKGSPGTSTPPRPASVADGSGTERQDGNKDENDNENGNGQRVNWAEDLPDARPPKKKMGTSPKEGGICAQFVQKSLSCLDEMVDVVIAKLQARGQGGSSNVPALRAQMRKTLSTMLTSGQMQKACVLMSTKKVGGHSFNKKKFSECVHASNCREFADCFYSAVFSSWKHSQRKPPSP